jgi:mRNA-degrading endonuclease RelE of RelBE toxin-antitoxin system
MFKKKLAERLLHPRVPASRLSGHQDRYKIKLRSAGYRLVYEVRDRELIVVVAKSRVVTCARIYRPLVSIPRQSRGL